MEHPRELLENDGQEDDGNVLDLSRETPDTTGEPAPIASSSDRSTDPLTSSSRNEDQILLSRITAASVNVNTRQLSSSEPSELSSQFTTTIPGLFGSGDFGISNSPSQSMPNLNEISSTQRMENLSTLNSNLDVFSTHDNIFESSRLHQPLSDLPSESLNLFPPRGTNSSDSTTAEVILPSTDFVDVLPGTSQSSNQRSLDSMQIPHHSEFRRQSESGFSILDPGNSEQSTRNDSFPDWTPEARNSYDIQSEHQSIGDSINRPPNELRLNRHSGPLPRHWQTGRAPISVPLSPPLPLAFKPCAHYWPKRRDNECRNEFISETSKSPPVDGLIFSPLKEVVQSISEAESTNLVPINLATSAIGLELSPDLVEDLVYLRETLTGMQTLYEDEQVFRRDLMTRSVSLAHLLMEVQITFTEIYHRLPTTSSSYREAAVSLMGRALVRVSVQRQYITDESRRFRRGNRRNPGSRENSYRDVRRLVMIMMEDIAFILALTAPTD